MQLNDTHPAIAVAELMRLLVDEHGMEWDAAWEITRAATAYTNHTLLPEALEKWPLPLFAAAAAAPPGDHLRDQPALPRRGPAALPRRRGAGRGVSPSSTSRASGTCAWRTWPAWAATPSTGWRRSTPSCSSRPCCGTSSNCVPERFHNVTNGVTPRRWVVLSNPGLAALITERLGGDGWVEHPEELRGLEAFARGRAPSRRSGAGSRKGTRSSWPTVIAERTGVEVDPASLFDVQVKRIHEYKRQHLNVLHIVTLYNRIKRDPQADVTPAHLHLRRQGGAGVLHGQADHQADHRGGGGGQRRPRRGRPPQGGVLPRLQRQATAS